MNRFAALATLAVALAVSSCGGSDDDTDDGPPPKPPPRETTDQLPRLPESWHRYVDGRAGFALGLPRGWKAQRTETGALVRSFDHLIAISIAPDRRPAAIADPLDDYAEATVARLRGFKGELRTHSARPFKHRYEGIEIRARGTAKGGVEQRVSVIALRRDRVALLTAVIAANAKRSADQSLRLAKRVVATLRSRRPVGFSIERADCRDPSSGSERRVCRRLKRGR